MNANAIARTEQRMSPRLLDDGRSVNEQCQSCLNLDTQRVVDKLTLEPFATYYQGNPFKVFTCFCCGALWHFEVPRKHGNEPAEFYAEGWHESIVPPSKEVRACWNAPL